MLQQFKVFVRDQLGLPPLVVFLVTGCLAHFALNALLRKSPTSAWGLLAPLVLAVGIESYEIWLQYKNVGLLAPENDPLLVILLRHGLDVVKMLAAPLLIVALGSLSTS